MNQIPHGACSPLLHLIIHSSSHRVLYSYLKPESARVQPEATVRPWATVQVIGDALSFAGALGYVYVLQIYP